MGAKWASLDPLGAEGFQVGRLIPNHLSLSPLIIIGDPIWSLAPFSCTHVGIVGPLVKGGVFMS